MSFTIKPNFSYEVSNTYVTDSGETRINVSLNSTDFVEVDGNFVNTTITVALFNFGIGSKSFEDVNVEELLIDAVPQYFIQTIDANTAPVSNT